MQTVYQRRICLDDLTCCHTETSGGPVQWLASECDTKITYAIILTDSMSLLQKMASEMGCPNWHTAGMGIGCRSADFRWKKKNVRPKK